MSQYNDSRTPQAADTPGYHDGTAPASVTTDSWSNTLNNPTSPTKSYRAYSEPQSVDPRDPHQQTSYPEVVSSHPEQDKYLVAQPNAPHAYPPDGQNQRARRTICGISALLFILILVLALIAVAGAVGGGVAGSMAAKDCRSDLKALRQSVSDSSPTLASETGTQASTASGSATATATSGPQQGEGRITVPETGCPDSNGTLYTASFGDISTTFMRICNSVKGGSDMFQISTPSWSSCMDACAEYYSFFTGLDTKGSTPACAGVSYVPEWSSHPEYAVSNYSTRGSCWFKSNMDALDIGWALPAEVVSSVRQD